jgi:hypothetical protein
MAPKYLYKIEVTYGFDDPEERINALAAEGWELISVVTIPNQDYAAMIRHYFRREAEKPASTVAASPLQ